MFKAVVLGLSASILAICSCSGPDEQATSDAAYVQQVAGLIAAMDATIDAHNLEADSSPRSIEKERARYDGWLAARDQFLMAFRSLEPNPVFADLHARAIVIVEDLRNETKALADLAHAATTLEESMAAWQEAPGESFRDADGRAHELCREVQDVLDSGVGQAIDFASPWLQTSAAVPIDVTVGCAANGP